MWRVRAAGGREAWWWCSSVRSAWAATRRRGRGSRSRPGRWSRRASRSSSRTWSKRRCGGSRASASCRTTSAAEATAPAGTSGRRAKGTPILYVEWRQRRTARERRPPDRLSGAPPHRGPAVRNRVRPQIRRAGSGIERSRWVRGVSLDGVAVTAGRTARGWERRPPAGGVVRLGGLRLRRYQRRQGSESPDRSSSRGTDGRVLGRTGVVLAVVGFDAVEQRGQRRPRRG